MSFDTQTSQKSLQRRQSDIGYDHFVAFKNENTFVNDQLNGNFVYLRKALLNTKKMVLDLSDTTYGVFAEGSTSGSLLETDTCSYSFSVQIDLEGTLFRFRDGSKMARLTLENQEDGTGLFIPIEVDKDTLLEQY